RFLLALAALASALAASLGFLLTPVSDIDDLTGLLGKANLASVTQSFESHPRGIARLGIDMRQVGQMNAAFLVDDAALLGLGLALMALDHVDALDQSAVFLGEQLQHFALLALVAAGNDDDLVALLDIAHHRTSGASEIIFIWFLARNSRVTGPNMRVP